MSDLLIRNFGYCHCCRSETYFYATNTWFRDYYYCERCHSIPRQRHVMAILDSCFAGWESRNIHESSPSADFISHYCRSYTNSHYFPEEQPGTIHDGFRCESIEALTFPDATFDIFITQDVLEHVFHPDKAIAEIQRTLKPGGAHVFTAPKHKGLLTTKQRASIDASDVITHILPPQYHGNPIGDGKALVTWDYGYDFEQLLSQWAGGEPVAAYHTLDRSKGLDAEYNEVFVIRKR